MIPDPLDKDALPTFEQLMREETARSAWALEYESRLLATDRALSDSLDLHGYQPLTLPSMRYTASFEGLFADTLASVQTSVERGETNPVHKSVYEIAQIETATFLYETAKQERAILEIIRHAITLSRMKLDDGSLSEEAATVEKRRQYAVLVMTNHMEPDDPLVAAYNELMPGPVLDIDDKDLRAYLIHEIERAANGGSLDV